MAEDVREERLRDLFVRGLIDNCLRDLMDGDPALLLAEIGIPVAAEQMHIHFMANLESAGYRLVRPEPWHVFDKDDNATWPSVWPEGDDVDCWVMVKGESEPEHQHWDPTNCGPERGWDSIRAEYVTHWMPIETPAPPQEVKE